MAKPLLLRTLETGAAWAVGMVLLSGIILGAAGASIVLGQLSCVEDGND